MLEFGTKNVPTAHDAEIALNSVDRSVGNPRGYIQLRHLRCDGRNARFQRIGGEFPRRRQEMIENGLILERDNKSTLINRVTSDAIDGFIGTNGSFFTIS